MKMFGPNNISQKTLKMIQGVYEAKLNNVEQGKVFPSKNKLLITTVGQPLACAIDEGRATDRNKIVADVRAALDQLHGMGIAHCDVALCNTFLLNDGTVMLGDLEYCHNIEDVAPSHLYRSIPRAKTAGDLDELQFQYHFIDKLDALLNAPIGGVATA